MAELIPIEYRVRVAQRAALVRWTVYGAVALIAVGAGIAVVGAWQHRQARLTALLQQEYTQRSALIFRSQELRTKRANLAQRMQRIQQLMDDKVLLSLLNTMAAGFSERDCLEHIQIDTRNGENGYLVKLSGITHDAGTLAELMKRLAVIKQPQVNVALDKSRRETFLDGFVMRFEISCERPRS